MAIPVVCVARQRYFYRVNILVKQKIAPKMVLFFIGYLASANIVACNLLHATMLAEALVYFAYVLTKASGSASPERLTNAKNNTIQTIVVAKPR